MPTFRCPKCRTPLNTDGSQPTVPCSQCGQLCAIPKQVTAPKSNLIQAAPPPPPRPIEPEPIVLEEVIEPDDDVLDVVPAAPENEDVLDIVEVADERSQRNRPRKPRKKGPEYKKPIWYKDDDERSSGWFTPESITTGILCLFGLCLMMATGFLNSGGTLLLVYGVLLQLIGIIWGIFLSGNDGEGIRAIFWVYRWIYLLGNLDRGWCPLAIEIAGLFFMVIGLAFR